HVQNPNWDWTTLSPAKFELLWRKSVEQYGAVIGTDDPDLARFRDRGGKVLVYHGLADELLPRARRIAYYKRVQQRMGGEKATAKFARLFLVPGVNHGFSGPGARPTGLNEAIIRWVEEGKAPDKLLAEKRDQKKPITRGAEKGKAPDKLIGEKRAPSGQVIRTRPLFPYPQAAKYKGSG